MTSWTLRWGLVALALSGALHAQRTRQEVEESLKNKVLIVRGFPTESRVTYAADGEPDRPIHSGPWTLSGIKVEKVEFVGRGTVIKGKRVGFTPENEVNLRKWVLNKNLELAIDGDISILPREQFSSLFYKVFLKNDEDWSELVPAYWRDYMRARYAKQRGLPLDSAVETTPGVYTVAGGVSAPRPLFTADPDYPEIARSLKYQGVVVLHMVVEETGKPTDIKVVRMQGLGLDEQAIEAVRKWRFKPAKKGNQPVPVAINVEINFNLY
jgi:TonB family protein